MPGTEVPGTVSSAQTAQRSDEMYPSITAAMQGREVTTVVPLCPVGVSVPMYGPLLPPNAFVVLEPPNTRRGQLNVQR